MKVQKYKKDLQFTYALGGTITIEALKNNAVLEVYIKSSCKTSDSIDMIINLCKENNIPLIRDDKPFNVLTNKNNCYVIAKVKKTKKILTNNNHIVLVNPSDSGNLGTIIRTSLGFGFKDIAIIRDAIDAFDPKVIRSSMGAIFNVNIEYFDNINDYMNRFNKHILYSFMLNAKSKLRDVQTTKRPYSLVFGNEASGLPNEYLSFTNPIIIPKSEEIDSFNLPIAASIAMYKFTEKDF